MTDLLPCPFCGETPMFNGGGNNWKDDNRYVEMSLNCCVAMEAYIWWSQARDIPTEERTKRMKESLTNRWNTRHTVEA